MQETLEFLQLCDRVSTAIAHLPQKVATTAVNFSKERFKAQNWVDNTTEPWKKRRGREKRAGRAILVDSGRLRRSIRKITVTNDFIVIGSDTPYGKAHNDGFRGRVTVKQHKRKGHTVKSHTKRMNMPRRRFIGASAVLTSQAQRLIISEIATAIKSK